MILYFVAIFICLISAVAGAVLMWFLMQNEIDKAYMEGVHEAMWIKPSGETTVRFRLLANVRNEVPHER